LVTARRELWTTCLARPENHSRETHRIRISGVPHKAIEPHVGRHRRRCTTATEKPFTRRLWRRCRAFTLLICLSRKLSNRLPCRIQKLQIDIRRWLRFQRIVDHNAVRRISTESRSWPKRETTTRHAITFLRLVQPRLASRTQTTIVHHLV